MSILFINDEIMSTSVKRTISFSDTTLEALIKSVPKSKRSKFVDNAVIYALHQLARKKALEAVENFKRIRPDGRSVVETLRDIRKEESDKFA